MATNRLPATKRTLLGLLALGYVGSVAACGTGEAADAAATVFFVEPLDGATLTSPFMVVFGAENIDVGAVPPEVEAPRPGVIHHHLGVGADCLPTGTVVPQASPWIHFGTGANDIEMNLEPGEHRLSVQAGDDEHRTIEGLCQTVTVTVVPQ